jgi:LysR family transcriptional regulator, glycine cleavage system transcriptional activator
MRAAEELALTSSAVSHQLANLEAQLGQKLFDRSTRGMHLTNAGRTYFEEVSSALGALNSATTRFQHNDEGAQVLRIHSAPSFASLWLMPRLTRFSALHPEIRISLSASHTHSDFSQGNIDLDIRYGISRWPELFTETIFQEEILPLISPALMEKLAPARPSDLLELPLIFSEVQIIQWPQWFAAHGVAMCPTNYSLRFDRAYLAIDAAVQGMGISLESHRLAERFLREGKLVRVFPASLALTAQGHHVVYPKAHRERARIQIFHDWLRAEAIG